MAKQSSIPPATLAQGALDHASRKDAQAGRLDLLVTRPSPQATRFVAALEQALPGCFNPIVSPLMAPEFLDVAVPQGGFAALVLTSETGAEAAARLQAAGAQLPRLAFCVGDRTAEVAQAVGFQARSAAGAAGDLVAMILAARPGGRLLYLHGLDRAADLGAALAPHGIEVISRAVYVQRAQPLSPQARERLAQPAPLVVALFSPRSARLFMAEAEAMAGTKALAARLIPVVISENARQALGEVLGAQAWLADHPDQAGMIRAVVALISGRSA